MNGNWQPYAEVDGRRLRRGYTTGMSAAAAAKSATQLLFGGEVHGSVEVVTPSGITISLPLSCHEKGDGYAVCGVIKDGGDDPDVTHGLEICARVQRIAGAGVILKGGPGVGVVTKPGLALSVGEPAINPVPRAIILREVGAVLPPGQGVEVIISVIGGEKAAERTLNPRLGIIGGISILGTSGIVEPMSEDAFRESLVPQLKVAKAKGYDAAVLTPGRIGEKAAVDRYGFPPDAVVLMSNFVGYMLREGQRLGMKGMILFGHHGKLVKVAAGVFHTHNKMADARLEAIASQAALIGAGPGVIGEIMECTTAEATLVALKAHGLMEVFPRLAERASRRARDYLRSYGDGEVSVGTVLLSLEGEVLGADATAVVLTRSLGAGLGCDGLR
ncbi:MAG: cobalt-precorrin-5B (C(1))-methyltransferase CbiD [Firmicutes bacterium]|nr:cobalt-precorrin-5B (C(1))-methyltransferase CbiD [Bacillota bacterium]